MPYDISVRGFIWYPFIRKTKFSGFFLHSLKRIRKKLYAIKESEGITFVHGIGRRKSAIQKSIESLEIWNLFDIDAKFGDVVPVDEVVKYLEGIDSSVYTKHARKFDWNNSTMRIYSHSFYIKTKK